MREAAFIKKSKDRWSRLEAAGQQLKGLSADEASELYVRLMDDLSYARTYYPRSAVVTYLNGLAAHVHQYVYRNKPVDRRRFKTFWTREVPLAVAGAGRELALSFGLFLLTAVIGAWSAHHDPDFVRLVIPGGDAYVDETIRNIQRGEPMAIYGSQPAGSMFLFITFNNVWVALFTFAAGVLFGLGTAVKLAQTGFMVGAFQYFFFEQGVGVQSVLSIWLHGTLEITAICIAGAAGFTLGNAMLHPGTLPRRVSIMAGARRGLTIAMGLVPVFIVAAFLESFVTRRVPHMPVALTLVIIGLSLAFLIAYFIILPFHVRRNPDPAAPGA